MIYKITCLLNGMKYVGQTTKSTEERFNQHASNKKSYIGRAIRKYGVENFSIEILEECDTCEQLNEREMFWIAALDCKHPNGYNFSDGGEGNVGWSHTPESITKMIVSHTGLRHTEQTNLEMSLDRRKE
ncbi:MAG: GIY-YIG nuclease family protein, partial [Selenomonadaceae bacterium]|nr:GIY-YIG nuclease family protein [Selenomonadaceae bacterium]